MAGLRRAPSVEIGERGGLRQVRDAQLFGNRLDAMKLLERPCGRRCVVIAYFFDADHRNPPAAQRAQLAAGHRAGHKIGRPGQSMNVGVESASPPRAFEFEAFLLERQLEGMDRGVELARESNRVQAQPGDRMVWLAIEDDIEVVDDFHSAGVERRGAGSFRDHCDVGPVATSSEGGTVTSDSSADDENFGQAPTIRRVSATSFLSC